MQTRQSIALALFAILLFPSVVRGSYGNELNTALGVIFFAGLYAIINAIITCINLRRKRFKAKDTLYYYTLISHALIVGLLTLVLLEAFVVIVPAFLLYSYVCIALPVLQYRRYASKPTTPGSPERGNVGISVVPIENALLEGGRYYTRKAEDAAIGGIYSADQLRKRLESGELSGDDRILEAIGQSLGRLKRTPLDEWTRLDAAFELTNPHQGHA